jgi:hypothetical protein
MELLPERFQPLLNTMVCQFGDTVVPIFTINWFFVLSYTSNPFAGLEIAAIPAVLILGINNPFDVLLTSSMADTSPGDEVALIAALCAFIVITTEVHRIIKMYCFIQNIFYVLVKKHG